MLGELVLSVDVDDVVKDRRRFYLVFSGAELPYPPCLRALSAERQLAVSRFVSSTQTPKQRIIDHPLPDGTVCDDRPPVLELCVNIRGTIRYSSGKCDETQCWYCESGVQVSKRYLQIIKERPTWTSEMEIDVPMYMFKRRKLGVFKYEAREWPEA